MVSAVTGLHTTGTARTPVAADRLDRRLRAVCDLQVASVREGSGLHEYDGQLQDLSPEGVRAALGRLGGEPREDPHDEAHLAAFEDGCRLYFDELEWHRRDPLLHMENLDLAPYDREYAPEPERDAARRLHLSRWPDAVDMALASLDAVSAPVATSLLVAVRGLSAGINPDAGDIERRALEAHARLVERIEHAAEHGDPDASLGASTLERLFGVPEALSVDLGALALTADSERDRLRATLAEGCARIDSARTPAELVPELLADHPDADGVLEEARAQTAEVIAFTREHDLAPYVDGECLVGPAPPSRSWAMAMMAWAGPEEPESPSWYYVTPPDPSWPAEDVAHWLEVFSRTTLPAITAHEVAPGHFAHGRSLRHASSPVRRLLHSMTFAEGWAHYAEEMVVEEGFRSDDPRFVVGVCLEALVRVTRLACSIGLHTGAMTVADATRRFEADAFLAGPAAAGEARRGTFDPTYGRYTWGKFAVLEQRERARAEWGAGFSLPRFHRALLDLGSPPIGLLGTAVERG
jgi:hypothetical protein